MQWVKIAHRLPKLNTTVLVEYFSGDYERKTYIGPEDWWKRNVHAWLDTEELSFNIWDIKLAYDTGWSRGFNHNYDEADRYLKQQYNIDITK